MPVIVSLALRYLVARARQSLLSIGGVTLGVLALTVIQSLMGGFLQEFVRRTLSTQPHITVRRRPLEVNEPTSPARAALPPATGPQLLATARPPVPEEEEAIYAPESMLARLRAVPGVAAAAPAAEGQALFGFGGTWEPVTLYGVAPERQAEVVEFAAHLRGGTARELERNQNGVVLGHYLAERMRVTVGDRVTARAASGATVSLRVVALYDSGVYDTDDTGAWVNLRRAQSLLGLGGAVNSLLVRVADYNQADEVARRLQWATGLEAESWTVANANSLGLLRMIVSIMYLVTALTMTVAGFGIAGTMVTTVSEKTFDIGVLKAMGMNSARIGQVFLLLAMIMTVLGVAAGLVLSYFAIEVIAQIPSGARPQPGVLLSSKLMPMARDWRNYAISGGFALLLSFLAGLSPALRAARLEPLAIIRNAAG